MTERWEKLAECRAAFVTDELAYYGWKYFEEFDEKPTAEDLKSPDFTLWTDEIQVKWRREAYADIRYADLRRRLGLSRALRSLVSKVKERTSNLMKKQCWRGAFMCSAIAYWTLDDVEDRLYWNDACWDFHHEDSLTMQENGYPILDAEDDVFELWRSVMENLPEESVRRTEDKAFELVSENYPQCIVDEVFKGPWSRKQMIRMQRCTEVSFSGVCPSDLGYYGPVRMRGREKTKTEEDVLQERMQETKEWMEQNKEYVDTREYWLELKELALKAPWATKEDVAFLVENTPPQELKNTLKEILESSNWCSREKELWTFLSEKTWKEAREKGVPVPELEQA